MIISNSPREKTIGESQEQSESPYAQDRDTGTTDRDVQRVPQGPRDANVPFKVDEEEGEKWCGRTDLIAGGRDGTEYIPVRPAISDDGAENRSADKGAHEQIGRCEWY